MYGYLYFISDYSPGTLWAICDAGACNENMICEGDYCMCMSGYVSNYDGTGCILEVIGGICVSVYISKNHRKFKLLSNSIISLYIERWLLFMFARALKLCHFIMVKQCPCYFYSKALH